MGDLERVVRAGSYSLAGLRAALRTEAAFRQLFVLFVIMAPLGLWLGNNAIERVLLVGCLVLVLIVELLNSAIEATVDRISKQRHKLSGRAKDMGSAAGMLSQLLVVFVWGVILLPRL
jgi:diacylglycerol kinase (ATP)